MARDRPFESNRMKPFRKLPVDIQSFKTMREDGYLYVDKTASIFRMVDEGVFYFLARPRRFGKSLLVSTLKSLFLARQSLFKGLWIAENSGWEWREHPVAVIDFNTISHDTPGNLKIGLERSLERTAGAYRITLDEPLLKEKFTELIIRLRDKTGTPVVVLVDEYDKPIIDHLGKGKKRLGVARANRDVLKNFLSVLKGSEVSSCLRLVFITGVSRFSRVSIFSDLNNLDDITMNDWYADMLGYTSGEMETYFKDYKERFARSLGVTDSAMKEKLARQYDGYRFSDRDVRVYNPFSILKVFKYMKFKDYWFETGTPTFLIDLLRKRAIDPPEMENMEIDEQIFSAYDIDSLQPEALLFQTGYLTIKDVGEDFYTFDYPNLEVKNAFLKKLFFSFSREDGANGVSRLPRLSPHLENEAFDAFFETMTALFASIPYTICSKRDEAYFHTLFYLMVSISGVDAESEVLSSDGRIDLVVTFPEKIFIVEFKCNQSAEAGIRQIRKKGYAEKYRAGGKKLLLMGVDFSTEKRNLADWKVEAY